MEYQGQVRWALELPGMMEGGPAHGRDGTWCSLRFLQPQPWWDFTVRRARGLSFLPPKIWCPLSQPPQTPVTGCVSFHDATPVLLSAPSVPRSSPTRHQVPHWIINCCRSYLSPGNWCEITELCFQTKPDSSSFQRIILRASWAQVKPWWCFLPGFNKSFDFHQLTEN